MKTLKLHPDFLPALLEGRKTTTVRSGWWNLSSGPCVILAGNQSVEVLVTDVRHCRYDELTPDDANRDGFATLDDLRSALNRFYPSLSDESAVSVIALQLLPRQGIIND